MPFDIIPNKSFLQDLKQLSKKYPSLKDDINDVVTILKQNPVLGEPLGKDCFKIRIHIKSKGKGKSGGGRLITCVKVLKSTVYLLAVFDKSEFKNISQKELTDRLKEIK
jgi:mRNA-degrading endonuclease RelE of RelBE toxin-antitoxin system